MKPLFNNSQKERRFFIVLSGVFFVWALGATVMVIHKEQDCSVSRAEMGDFLDNLDKELKKEIQKGLQTNEDILSTTPEEKE